MLGASATSYRRSMMFANDPGAVVVQLIFGAVDAFALTVLVFFRKGFGERFYTVFKFGMGVAILSLLMGLRALAQGLAGLLPLVMGMAGGMMGVPPVLGMLAGGSRMMNRAPPPPPHALFDAANLLYWAFILVGGAQLIFVWLRSWRIGDAMPVHSKSTGEPLLSFGGRVNHWLAVIFLEPVAILLLGRVLVACDPNMPYAYFVVLALFIQASALHQWRLYRDDMLDEQDARLLAGFYSAQAKHVEAGGKPLAKIAGFFMPLVLPKKPALQLDVLRQWAKRHQDGATDEPPPPAPPPAASA